MSSRPILIVGSVVVLGGLIAGVVVLNKKNQGDIKTGEQAAKAAAADVPTIGVTSAEDGGLPEVDTLSLTNGNKPEVVLAKKDDKWVMVKPVDGARLNQQRVKDALLDMKDWKIVDKRDAKLDDAGLGRYHLDPAQALRVTAKKGATTLTDVLWGVPIGGSPPMPTLMMIPEGKDSEKYKGQMYAANGYHEYKFKYAPKEWRDVEVFKWDDASTTQIALSNKAGGDWLFAKTDKGWSGSLNGKPLGDRLDEEKVKQLLGAFSHLNAEDFADGKAEAETGVGSPEATLSFSVSEKDKTEKHVIKVGKDAPKDPTEATPKELHYAAREGDPTVFTITKTAFDWALADKDKFTKPQAAPDGGAPADAGHAPHAPAPDAPKKKQP